VSVPAGWRYLLCAPGQTPLTQQPCDPGVSASDAQDGVAIQRQVLLCPPADCFGSAQGCVGHRVYEKDVLACGIDTQSADVGTTYTLTFVVYNSSKCACYQHSSWVAGWPTTAAACILCIRCITVFLGPVQSLSCTLTAARSLVWCAVGLSASLSRVVTVTSPCAASEYFCPDDRTCSQVQCSLRGSLPTNDMAQNDTVSVVLLPIRGMNVSESAGANRTLYLEYGK
jgi:hypothetical protein